MLKNKLYKIYDAINVSQKLIKCLFIVLIEKINIIQLRVKRMIEIGK